MQEDWDLADQRELYEVQWTLFVSNKNPERKLSYSDIPWPGISTAAADILQVVLYGTQVTKALLSGRSVLYCRASIRHIILNIKWKFWQAAN